MLCQWENVQLRRFLSQRRFETDTCNFQDICLTLGPFAKAYSGHLQMMRLRAICNCIIENFYVILRIDADIKFSLKSDMLCPLASHLTYANYRTYFCMEILQNAINFASHVKSMGICMAITQKLAQISI